jgi:hypothetical protein
MVMADHPHRHRVRTAPSRAPARDDVKNNRVGRLKSADTAVELGGFVGLNLGRWHAEVWVTQDVADAYDGQLAGLNGGYAWPVECAAQRTS